MAEQHTQMPRFDMPRLDMPKFDMPKFDMDVFVAMQKANVETMVAAQKIMFDLAQTVTKRQVDLVKEMMGQAEGMMKGFDGKKQPTAYVDEYKAAFEKAMADVKETMDMGMKAQAEVVDLFVKRASANLDDVKQMAA